MLPWNRCSRFSMLMFTASVAPSRMFVRKNDSELRDPPGCDPPVASNLELPARSGFRAQSQR